MFRRFEVIRMFTMSPYASRADADELLSGYRDLLVEQWREQLDVVKQLSIEADSGRDADGGQATGARTDQESVTARLLVAARRQLEETESALHRLDNGSYGICVGCRLPIATGRLQVLPAARFCVSCQRGFTTPSRALGAT